jgi:hypothetical protein
MSIYTCQICKKDFKCLASLTKHLTNKHQIKDVVNDYHRLYNESLFAKCVICNTTIYSKYKTDKQHSKTCSKECLIKFISGRKQSEETISKRVKNTNQEEKEKKKRQTLLERYGVDCYLKLIDIGKKLKGRKMPPRKKEHSDAIIESKRKNGTLKHSEKAKEKIKKSLLELYASDNPPVIVMGKNNNVNHKHGHIHGFYYRSSYEKKFIEYCVNNNIAIETAETKEFRVPYIINGKRHFYYPDFYLPDYDLIIEIKPVSLLTDDVVQCKIDAIARESSFSLVCEEELENLDEYFLYLEKCDRVC